MKKLIVLLLMGAFLLSGCASLDLYKGRTAQEIAIINVELLSSWYIETHQKAKDLTANGTEEEKTIMKTKVNPALNSLKPLIMKHNELVNLWKTTNVKPNNLEETITEIQKVVLGIINILGTDDGGIIL